MNNHIPYLIREANITDAEAMAKVNIASWRSTYAGLIDQNVLDSMEFEQYHKKWIHILGQTTESSRWAFVAEIDGTVIGYVTASQSPENEFGFEVELKAIYLLEAFQGKGIGNALWMKMIEAIKSKGCNSMFLYVLKNNSIGRSFYDRYLPDELQDASITIEQNVYCDMLYGWRSIEKILQRYNS